MNSSVSDNALEARMCKFLIVHGSFALASKVGFVVTPWNIPRGKRSSHSDVSAVSRKNLHSPRCGGVNDIELWILQSNTAAVRRDAN